MNKSFIKRIFQEKYKKGQIIIIKKKDKKKKLSESIQKPKK